MVGATTPFFVSLLGFLLFNDVHHWRVYASLIPIVGGILLSTYYEGNLSVVGFLFIVTATFFRGFRTVFQGHLLAGEEKLDSPNLLKYMSMNACAILSIVSLLFEGKSMVAWLHSEKTDTYSSWLFVFLLVINPLGAYVANLSQMYLIQVASPLTFQVIGNSKGVVTIVASIIVFRNEVTLQAALGYTITLAGVAWYTREKTLNNRRSTRK